MSVRRWSDDLSIAIGVLVLGASLLVGTLAIPAVAGYERIGPAAFPWLISIGLIVVGCVLAWNALREGTQPDVHTSLRVGPPAFIVLGLLLHLLLLERAGFVVASSILFVCTALAFGTRHRLLTLAMGIGLALAAYLAFARGLGLELPSGVLGVAP
jgi:putative tricarboxylic transport membrane protein